MDNLGRMLNKINTIEKHMKYLQCLQHIEELRYCEIMEMKTMMSCQRQTEGSWLNRPKLNAHLYFFNSLLLSFTLKLFYALCFSLLQLYCLKCKYIVMPCL